MVIVPVQLHLTAGSTRLAQLGALSRAVVHGDSTSDVKSKS